MPWDAAPVRAERRIVMNGARQIERLLRNAPSIPAPESILPRLRAGLPPIPSASVSPSLSHRLADGMAALRHRYKLALGVCTVIAMIGVAQWLIQKPTASGLAFAQVVENVGTARTLSYKVTGTMNGKPTPLSEYTALVLEPGRIRQTMCGGA